MTLTKIADADLLESGTMTCLDVNGIKILLANVEGKYYAMKDKCNHFGASLSKGCLEGTRVKCPKHNVKFDLRTGYPNCKGKMLFFDFQAKEQEIYSVTRKGKSLFIDPD